MSVLTCMPQSEDAPEVARTLRQRAELAGDLGNHGLAAVLRIGADMIDHLYQQLLAEEPKQ